MSMFDIASRIGRQAINNRIKKQRDDRRQTDLNYLIESGVRLRNERTPDMPPINYGMSRGPDGTMRVVTDSPNRLSSAAVGTGDIGALQRLVPTGTTLGDLKGLQADATGTMVKAGVTFARPGQSSMISNRPAVAPPMNQSVVNHFAGLAAAAGAGNASDNLARHQQNLDTMNAARMGSPQLTKSEKYAAQADIYGRRLEAERYKDAQTQQKWSNKMLENEQRMRQDQQKFGQMESAARVQLANDVLGFQKQVQADEVSANQARLGLDKQIADASAYMGLKDREFRQKAYDAAMKLQKELVAKGTNINALLQHPEIAGPLFKAISDAGASIENVPVLDQNGNIQRDPKTKSALTRPATAQEKYQAQSAMAQLIVGILNGNVQSNPFPAGNRPASPTANTQQEADNSTIDYDITKSLMV